MAIGKKKNINYIKRKKAVPQTVPYVLKYFLFLTANQNIKNMAAVHFVLKNPPKEGTPKKEQNETLVYMLFTYSNTRLKISTGKKIYPFFWDTGTQRAKEVAAFNSHVHFNIRLNQFQNSMLDCYDRLILDKIKPTNDKLKEALYKKMELNGRSNKLVSLNMYIDLFIQQLKSGERLTERKTKYQYNTIRTFTDFRNQFTYYQTDRKRDLNYEDINLDFYNDLVKYFTMKNYAPNSIGRVIKNLKTIMRAAREDGLHKNMEIERKKFKTIKTSTDQIYLTQTEIDKIYKLDLNENSTLDVARDIFMIGYYTAQRFSDFSRIVPENFKTLNSGVQVIELVQSKTNEKVTIPIHYRLKEIFEKYNYKTPSIPVQKLNKRIKLVGDKAEIKDIVVLQGVKGGIKITITKPKFEFIKTHTARRSAATNMYLAKIPTIDIMKITGHKTEREFLNYIRVSKEETAEALSNHSYYQQEMVENDSQIA